MNIWIHMETTVQKSRCKIWFTRQLETQRLSLFSDKNTPHPYFNPNGKQYSSSQPYGRTLTKFSMWSIEVYWIIIQKYSGLIELSFINIQVYWIIIHKYSGLLNYHSEIFSSIEYSDIFRSINIIQKYSGLIELWFRNIQVYWIIIKKYSGLLNYH